MNRTPALLVAVACAALVVAGCGSSKKSSSTSAQTPAQTSGQTTTSSTPTSPTQPGGAASSLKLSADPSGQLKFDKSSLTAKAGKVSIVMANPSSVPHAVAIQGNGVNKSGQTVQQGGTSSVSVKLKPGKYTFYCPVDGHRQAGMQGTLTVK